MFKSSFIILLFLANLLPYTIGRYVRICNQGVYLAKCYLESRSFNYMVPIFKYDTGLFPILQCSTIDLPFDAAWNRIECKALIFIAVYKTIFAEEFPSGLLNSCYIITGSILNPTWSQTQC